MKKLLFGLLSAVSLFCLPGCNVSDSHAQNNQFSLVIEDATTTTAPVDTTTLSTETTASVSSDVTTPVTVYETTVPQESTTVSTQVTTIAEVLIDRNGSYTTKEDVALYIHTYGELPANFITKKEAQALGWTGGSLEPYAKGKCIGGTFFGNYEGHLPTKKGRTYTECDIDTLGKSSRGAKRIVFSNDGLIYYTDDHYETFTLLYGEETS